MNNYITLDGYKYSCPFGQWEPSRNKPSSVRMTLSGKTDVTYGPASEESWAGLIRVTANSDLITAGYGTRANFLTTYDKTTSVTFVDHEGNSCSVHVIGALSRKSTIPIWDSTNANFFYSVNLIKVNT